MGKLKGSGGRKVICPPKSSPSKTVSVKKYSTKKGKHVKSYCRGKNLQNRRIIVSSPKISRKKTSLKKASPSLFELRKRTLTQPLYLSELKKSIDCKNKGLKYDSMKDDCVGKLLVQEGRAEPQTARRFEVQRSPQRETARPISAQTPARGLAGIFERAEPQTARRFEVQPSPQRETERPISAQTPARGLAALFQRAEVPTARKFEVKSTKDDFELPKFLSTETQADILKRKAAECRAKGLVYDAKAKECLSKSKGQADWETGSLLGEGIQYETQADMLKRKAAECRAQGLVYDAKAKECVKKSKGQSSFESGDLFDIAPQIPKAPAMIPKAPSMIPKAPSMISKKQDNCGMDEYLGLDKCLKYSDLRSFDTDDCEDDDLVFDWKHMKCAASVDEEENAFFNKKYQTWQQKLENTQRLLTEAKENMKPQDGRSALLSAIQKGTSLKKSQPVSRPSARNPLLSQIEKGTRLKKSDKLEEEKLKKAIEDCEKDARKIYNRVKGCIDRKFTSEQLAEIEALERKAKGIELAAQKWAKKEEKKDENDEWDE